MKKRRIEFVSTLVGLIVAALVGGGTWYTFFYVPPLQSIGHDPEQLLPYQSATTWRLYSLEPHPLQPLPHSEAYYHRRILGSIDSDKAEQLHTIVENLIEASEQWNGGVAMCYDPRHGIRITHGDDLHDMVICYECSTAELFRNGESVGGIRFASDANPVATPTIANAILDNAGIPRDKPR